MSEKDTDIVAFYKGLVACLKRAATIQEFNEFVGWQVVVHFGTDGASPSHQLRDMLGALTGKPPKATEQDDAWEGGVP